MTTTEADAVIPVKHLLAAFKDGDEDGWDAEFAWLEEHHSDRLDQLATSIQETGIHEPIELGEDGRVWNGHHRLAAAHRLGLYDVPVKFVPENEARAKAAQLMLDSAGPTGRGTFGMKFSAGDGEAARVLLLIADSMRTTLDEMEAPNYVEMELKASDGKQYIMTIARGGRPTPHQMRQRAENAIARVREALARDEHVIDVTTTGWSLLHGFPCRPNLLDCPLHRDANTLDGPPAAPGRYLAYLRDGHLRLGQPVAPDYDPLDLSGLIDDLATADDTPGASR